jgi:glycopeptide antibiotics resistance protein
MKKIYIIVFLSLIIFCSAFSAKAITELEKQQLIKQIIAQIAIL